MTTPLLTIAIPTYNRCEYLKQTLDVVFPQQTSEVEILVCDNASSDGTAEYLSGLGEAIRHFRQETNVGGDNNFLSCITLAKGQYVWTLCDDDLPCSNLVETLLVAIQENGFPPVLFVSAKSSDKQVSDYDAAPVQSQWLDCNRDEFLARVGIWFTFGSSAVVRRNILDMDFIRGQNGTLLIPAAILLSSVGRSNRALVSSDILLYARGDNTGGYNGLVTFTKNLSYLLKCSLSFGYSPSILKNVYNHNLSMVVVLIVETWRINAQGLFSLVQYSYRSRCFYTHVVPALVRRALRSVKHIARSAKHSLLISRRAQA